MKRFQEITRKVVSIKTFTKRYSYVDDEHNSVLHAIPKQSRDELLNEVMADPASIDVKTLYQLCKVLLEESINASSGGTPSLYCALALLEWIVQRDTTLLSPTSATPNAGSDVVKVLTNGSTKSSKAAANNLTLLSPPAMIKWAEGHFELWSRKGVAAEDYHLARARQLYESAFRRRKELCTAATLHAYCKILTLLGDMEAAAAVAQKILNDFEHDGEYANYLFYTGGVFKALGQHEKANTYFFEASEVGPPKFFTKLEMMMIISRTIEQENSNEDTEEEGAYKMVHAHLQLEGLIEESLDYEDWISQSNTWLQLGDKCAMHCMFALATDFYGLGIMKDPDAFRKPMLWLRFAKACRRCGRVSDGILAVKQALSYDPFNPQLLRTQAFWAAELTAFQALAASDLPTILGHVPREMEHNDAVLSRTQAILKGVLERRGMNLGVGSRKDITRRMTARIGVLLESRKGGATSTHPVLLTVRPAWSGLITNIRVFDLENNHLGAIPLKTPFAPMKETGLPRKLTLSLSCRRIKLRVTVDANKCGFESDEDEIAEMGGRALPFKRGAVQTTEEVVTELKFTFTDESTGQYTCRRMKLNFDDLIQTAGSHGSAVREFTTAEYVGATVADTGGNALDDQKLAGVEDRKPPAVVATNEHTSPHGPATAASTKSVINRLSVHDDSAAPTVTETNIECAEILRQGLQYKSKYYMVRIVNEIDVTQVTLLPVHSDRVFVFMMTREHIDRTHSLNKRLVELLQILESNELVEPLFCGRQGLAAEEAAMIENPSICKDRHCFVHLHPHSQGATIILVHPGNLPMLGSGFEVMEDDLVVPEDGPASRAPSVRLAGSASRKSVRGLSVRGLSVRGGPMFMSSRMRSTKSFRNNAIDEFLYGNMNPPAVIDDAEDDEDDFGRSVSYKGRDLKVNVLPTIHSEGAMQSSHASGTVSTQDSFVETVGFEEADDAGSAAGALTEDQLVLKDEDPPMDAAVMAPNLANPSGEDEESGDEFSLAPLPSIAAKTTARPSSIKLAKRPPRMPAAGVRAAARRGMSDGMTLERALAAAAELQTNFFSAASKKGHSVSWDEWEADQRDEEAVLQSALSAGSAEDSAPHPAEAPGSINLTHSDRTAVDYLEEGNEEEFLRQIVDVPWIEELGSTEVVEYVLQDVISIFIQTTVAIIAQQYSHLPIFSEFVDEVIQKGTATAEKSILQMIEHEQNAALDVTINVMTDEIIEEIVDELAEERINKLNLMAFKAAVAAQAAAAEAETKKKAKINKKPSSAVSGTVPAASTGTAVAPPASKAELSIIIPEPKDDVPPEPRTADVQFSQPYRAAPDTPEPSVPVKYNVVKISSKVTVSRHSSRPYSKRDTLVPVLGVGNAIGKKRHTPDALLSTAQTYHPPEYLGQQTPLNSVYTGTFSRLDAFPQGVDEGDIDAGVKSRKLPSRQLHVLRLNTIKALPVIEVDAGGLNREVSEPTDLTKPSGRAQGLRHALTNWGDEGEAGPIISVSTITEASQQPFRNSFTVPAGRGHLALGYEDDGTVSIRSDNSGGSSPVFKNIQRRKLQLPVDEESVYSVGSSSRAGARRSPNKRTMLDANDQHDSSNELLSLAGSFGDELSGASEMCSVRTSTGKMRRQLRSDPLKVPPRGHDAAEKKRIARESLDDFKYIGYVKDRPLVHSSHWRGKLFSYLSGLRNADHLRKHVAMLTKATNVTLSPEEAVCALADTSGSVGEVADKLKNLEFYSELKLVCRSLHVRSMVCMLEGGERLFKDTPVDTFGDRGEFDDFSVFANEQLKKRAEGSSISRSLQHSRSVMAKGHKPQKPTVFDLSKTAPLGSLDQPPILGDYSVVAASVKVNHAAKSSTAPPAGGFNRVSFSQERGPSERVPVFGAATEDGPEEVGLLAKLFHFERDEPITTTFPEEDDNSSMTSLSMSLGSTTSYYADSFKYAPHPAAPHATNPAEATSISPGKPHGLTRSNTAASTSSAGSGSVASHHTAASAADQAASQLTPGIRSILSLPRQNTTMDLKAEAASVQSKATFVPLKFASTGGSKSRLDIFPSPKKVDGGFPDSPQSGATGSGLSPKWANQPFQGSRTESVSAEEFSPSASSALGTRSSMLADRILASAVAVRASRDTDEDEDESAGGDAAAFRPSIRRGMPARRSSMGSFRLAGRIDDLLVEHGDVPLAVMCRRDFLKAQQDEVLLKSDKNYIRRPIEKKIGLLRSSIDNTFVAPIIEDI